MKKDGVIEMVGKRHVCVPNLQTLLEEAGDDSDGEFYLKNLHRRPKIDIDQSLFLV